jgi:hypothetical protein
MRTSIPNIRATPGQRSGLTSDQYYMVRVRTIWLGCVVSEDRVHGYEETAFTLPPKYNDKSMLFLRR